MSDVLKGGEREREREREREKVVRKKVLSHLFESMKVHVADELIVRLENICLVTVFTSKVKLLLSIDNCKKQK